MMCDPSLSTLPSHLSGSAAYTLLMHSPNVQIFPIGPIIDEIVYGYAANDKENLWFSQENDHATGYRDRKK